MSNMLEINCLVFGDDHDHIFTIEIADTENIGALKDAIKEEKRNTFQNVDANTLILRKVSLPVDERLKENIGNIVGDKPLLSTEELSDVFSETLPQEHLHLVVERPTVVLNCFLLGDAPNRTFAVEIPKTKNISVLTDLIKAKNPLSLGNVDAKGIALWQVSFPIDDLPSKNLDNLIGGSPQVPTQLPNEEPRLLLPMHILSEIFPEPPIEKHVHIIIQPPQTRSPLTQADLEEKDNIIITALKTRREQAVKNALNAKKPLIHDGMTQSEETRAPPIQLFHPVFGHFLDDLLSESPIPPEVSKATIDYMRAASAIYESEEVRRVKLRPHLCRILAAALVTTTNADKTSPEGVVSISLEQKQIYEVAIILLSKHGYGNGDPSTQAGLSAVQIWAQDEHEVVRDNSCCPTFLLAAFGPWFVILGLVFTDKWIVQRLTDFIWVGLDATLHDAHDLRVARIFYSLRTNMKRLREYYAGLEAIPVDPSSTGLRPHFFPSICAYCDEVHGVIRFTYVKPLDVDSTCVTFLARTTTDTPKPVVIKFVQRYGEKAHQLLAKVNLAPQLFYYGKIGLEGDPSYGHLRMVVMEYVDGKLLIEVNPTPPGLKDKIRHALNVLHGQGYVFGDLRPQNIMMTENGGIKLIDFDWAGVDGQSTYPLMINCCINWPAGVKARSIMETWHDVDMLGRMELEEQ